MPRIKKPSVHHKWRKGETPVGAKPWKKGQSGNPKGRPTAGATLREWLNIFADQNLTEKALRKIARDPVVPWPKRAAAHRVVRMLESGDLADFSGLLRGENNLEDLRGMGINTEVIKKLKQKTRVVPTGDGSSEEIIEREIELHDRAGLDFDRVFDRTEGRPSQAVDLTSGGKEITLLPIVLDGDKPL